VSERVVPGVAADEDLLAGLDALHLAGLGVGDDHRPIEDVEDLVGREDGSIRLGVAERAARREAYERYGRAG